MIILFGRKSRKKELFGKSIEPNCQYCTHNRAGEEEAPFCALHQIPEEDGACRRFSYDPLRRTPKNLPPLPKFDPEDFSL